MVVERRLPMWDRDDLRSDERDQSGLWDRDLGKRGRPVRTENRQQRAHRIEHAAEEGREWSVIERMPCAVKLLRVVKLSMGFYDFEEYAHLVDAAATDPNALLIVLLGGEAGLRCEEMMALEWRDVDLAKRQICVQRSEWKGHVTAPKGGRLRYVPLTVRLATALREHRHLRSARVLCRNTAPLSADVVKHPWNGRLGVRGSRRTGCIACAIRSARIWRCGGRRPEHPGAGRPHGLADHAALHAPHSCGARGSDPAGGIPQNRGDGGSRFS
jgi:integrase